MEKNIIRAGIFFVAGLIILIFPQHVYKFQMFVIEKMYNIFRKMQKTDPRKGNRNLAIALIIIGILLFLYTIIIF